jgi:GT2 family glycosyltransferase
MTGLEHCFPSIFLPKTIMEWPPDGIREVDQVIVAFFFVRRIVFDALEGSDERFFVYFEEVDFSLRTRMDGWSS